MGDPTQRGDKQVHQPVQHAADKAYQQGQGDVTATTEEASGQE